jgi:hypothetical protein
MQVLPAVAVLGIGAGFLLLEELKNQVCVLDLNGP